MQKTVLQGSVRWHGNLIAMHCGAQGVRIEYTSSVQGMSYSKRGGINCKTHSALYERNLIWFGLLSLSSSAQH